MKFCAGKRRAGARGKSLTPTGIPVLAESSLATRVLLLIALPTWLLLTVAIGVSLAQGSSGNGSTLRGRLGGATAVHWVVLGHPGRNGVRIGNNVGWCPDSGTASRPRITGVKQVDRPHTVVLTAYLSQRSHRNCAGVEILVEYTVHIRGGLRGRTLYDGSKSPPVQRWLPGNSLGRLTGSSTPSWAEVGDGHCALPASTMPARLALVHSKIEAKRQMAKRFNAPFILTAGHCGLSSAAVSRTADPNPNVASCVDPATSFNDVDGALLSGGEAGPCLRYTVPMTEPPGRYRLLESVVLSAVGTSASHIDLTNEFRVGLGPDDRLDVKRKRLLLGFRVSGHPALAASSRRAAGVSSRFCGNASIRVEGDPPPFKARMGISETAVRPGGVLRIRLENVGAGDLSYGLAYELARRAHGSWTKVPTGPFFAPLYVVRAGTVSPCESVDIPRDADPGRYRITKKLRPVGPGRTAPVVVRATFQVQGTGGEGEHGHSKKVAPERQNAPGKAPEDQPTQ